MAQAAAVGTRLGSHGRAAIGDDDLRADQLFVFLALIPGVGAIILFVFTLLPSNPAGARFDATRLPKAPGLSFQGSNLG